MRDIREIKLTPKATIRKALEIIDQGAVKFAIVVDDKGVLLGTLTDGDIRRAFLRGKGLNSPIEGIYTKEPTTVGVNASRDEIIEICKQKRIYQIPVVDELGRVVDVQLFDELLKPEVYPNRVILMAGGLGLRLRPLTEKTPKPMLHVGGKPILQSIIERFARHGFINITLCLNYKADLIMKYFGDGSKYGVHIDYIIENKRMGTAGALSLLNNIPVEPFFVMNGDLLTNVNFEHLLEYHLNSQATATVCVREYDFQVPYGIVNVEGSQVMTIEEKPVHKFFVNAGIYMLNPECLSLIPDEFYEMPTLLQKLIHQNLAVYSFPLREYWLDIGQIDEYARANREYGVVFND